MLVKLSKNTFVRFSDDGAYITNQVTRFDRTYNDIGADFLKQISRNPRNIDNIVQDLSRLYGDSVTLSQLQNDFISFVNDLDTNKFLIVGQTAEELESNDYSFSYSNSNPKTMIKKFYQEMGTTVQENTEDYMLEAAQRKPALRALQFELTSRCNERCIHCYIPNAKKNAGKDMSLSTVKRLVDEFADMGGLHVTLSGGEVFMHKDVIPIIEYCREKDMIISVLSNLISLKQEHIRALKEANISIIQTSLYSMDPSIHDYITTIKGSHAKTIKAIENLVAADVPVQISCPTMKANATGYTEVLKYAQSIKCKSQTDYIMMAQSDFGTGNLANRLSLEETEVVIRGIIENDADYREDILSLNPLSDNTEEGDRRYGKLPLCGAGINDCCITANGDVYPCAGWQAMVCGNIFKTSLKEIWETSEKLKEIRQISRDVFPQCMKCEAKNYCAMCLVRNYNESNGDMFKINQHFCDVAFLNKRIVEEYCAKTGKQFQQ